VQAYRNSSVVLGLRPEQIGIHATAGPGNPLATLRLIEPLGAETLLYLQIGNSACIARVSGIPEVRIGQQLAVQWDTRNARFFDPTSGQRI
jgi:multiple sugar transport system ATP-binding protein